ncbi:MAG: polymerase, sigma-24 subunit, subfamily [Nocardioidaceae bacterium]|nr:polymerase, sigma-24 subunit, subfamily [Nocardioidaceae bacterium]
MGRGRDVEFTEFAVGSLRDLRRTAYLVCGDWHLAEDLAQDALIRVYRSWDRIERRESLAGYARRTTVRLAIDHARKPRRRERPGPVPDRVVTDATADLGERDEVTQALATLAPRQRACLVLRFHLDCTVAETARVLGCSEGTVKSQTSDALTRLRAALGVSTERRSR